MKKVILGLIMVFVFITTMAWAEELTIEVPNNGVGRKDVSIYLQSGTKKVCIYEKLYRPGEIFAYAIPPDADGIIKVYINGTLVQEKTVVATAEPEQSSQVKPKQPEPYSKYKNPVFADTEYVFTNLFSDPQNFAEKHLVYAKSDAQLDYWVGAYRNVGEIQLGLNNGTIKYCVIKIDNFDAYNIALPIIENYYGSPRESGEAWGGYQSKWILDDVWANLGAAVVYGTSYYNGDTKRSFMMFEVHPRN